MLFKTNKDIVCELCNTGVSWEDVHSVEPITCTQCYAEGKKYQNTCADCGTRTLFATSKYCTDCAMARARFTGGRIADIDLPPPIRINIAQREQCIRANKNSHREAVRTMIAAAALAIAVIIITLVVIP